MNKINYSSYKSAKAALIDSASPETSIVSSVGSK